MNKENNRSAAGLRRSAIVERQRLREEWSALKGTESQKGGLKQNTNILTKKQTNVKSNAVNTVLNVPKIKESTRNRHLTNDTLRGVVALVEVGTECRALPLRAALSALGASVLPAWSPLVTHLVWTQGGCRATRAKARALACRLVSPLWVEACAASSTRLPEQAFPAAARASDLPSPRTLRRLLKKAEMENIPIPELLSDSNEDNKQIPRLRISSETEQDTSADLTTDISRDTSHDTSRDKSTDASRDTTKDTTDVESRVNTAPRRALPLTLSVSPDRPAKSRRKLFTQKEAEVTKRSDYSDDSTAVPKPIKPTLKPKHTKNTMKHTTQTASKPKLTQKDRKELARAERMAKKILAGCTPIVTQGGTAQKFTPRIVLTGMTRTERRSITEAVKSLGGRIQKEVDRRTTHVLLGSCGSEQDVPARISGITNLSPADASRYIHRSQLQKARTLNALHGAARGCRVLYAHWALHCKEQNKWIHHSGYEVPHLKKISQKARVERSALGKSRSEYAYDVFNGMRVRVSASAEQREAAIQLLTLCGAVVIDGSNCTENNRAQNGGLTQDGGLTQNGGLTQIRHNHTSTEYDIKLGNESGDVISKWVFDSVAVGRMRTTRRYLVDSTTQNDLVSEMARFQC